MNYVLRAGGLMLLGCATLFATEPTIISLTSLSQDNTKLVDQWMQGGLEDTVFELPAGLEVPLDMVCESSILSMRCEGPSYRLCILEPCYVRRSNETILFSRDRREWLTFEQLFTGTLRASLADSEGLKIKLELDYRTS